MSDKKKHIPKQVVRIVQKINNNDTAISMQPLKKESE